jgi:hypothetical protein
MYEIKNEIEIEAPVDHVWSVLVDRDRYCEWNPVIMSQQGVLERGCEATMRINPALFAMTVPLVYQQVSVNRELSWFGGPPLVKGFHYFRLEKLDNGNTKLIHGEQFSLLATLLSFPVIATLVRRKYEKADWAFKHRCELLLRQAA